MTKTTVFPPMPMVSRSVATVPLTYPLTKGMRGNSAPALTADNSKRRPDREHCTQLDSATP